MRKGEVLLIEKWRGHGLLKGLQFPDYKRAGDLIYRLGLFFLLSRLKSRLEVTQTKMKDRPLINIRKLSSLKSESL